MQVISRYDREVSATGLRRPGGRSARVRAAVHAAVLEILEENPWDALTVAMVAERSGVHQATIYRRWESLSGVLDDVVAEQIAQTAPIPDTGSLRGDLGAYAEQVAAHLAGSLGTLILRAAFVDLGTGTRPRMPPAVMEREQPLRAMLDRAGARGEDPPAHDQLIDVVLAPLYFHTLFGTPLDAEGAHVLVDRLLALTAQRQSPGVPPPP
jgi:AcrR family transcriptional regulator